MGRRNGRSEDLEDGEKSGFIACYLLTSLSPRYKDHTYIGFTVNPRRRIRQHNGKLCGGACSTKEKRPWEMVLCIYGFPTNDHALQFELAWQYPKKWGVRFKYLDGLANKIKVAYRLLTSAWKNLKLTVNFFSTKYTKYYAGCPSLPSHMRVCVRSMDELPCYTEVEDDMFGLGSCSWDDDEEPDHRAVGSEATFTGAAIPVLVSEESTCVLDIEYDEQPSCSNDSLGWLFSSSPEISASSIEVDVIDLLTPSRELRTKSPRTKSTISASGLEVIDPFTPSPESRSKSRISDSSVEVEVMDLITPSPELRTKSRRTKRTIPFVCPEIVDLTQSTIYV